MNRQRKIITSGIGLLATIPVLFVLSVALPVGNSIHTLESSVTDEELIQNSDMIVKGTLVNSETVELFYGADPKTPKIYTKWTISPDTVFKGESDSKYIEALMPGGEKEGFATIVDHVPDMHKGDVVILFLNKDPESVFGDNYVIAGPVAGTYLVRDGIATNEISDKTASEGEIIAKIQTTLGN